MKRLSEHTIKRPLSSESLINYFNERCEIWPYPMISGECFTVGVFYNLVIKPYEAFDLIPAAIQIIFDNEDSSYLTNAFTLLSDLVGISNTSEVPKIFKEHLIKLNSIVNKHLEEDFIVICWESICKQYRRNLNNLREQ